MTRCECQLELMTLSGGRAIEAQKTAALVTQVQEKLLLSWTGAGTDATMLASKQNLNLL